MLVAIIGGHLLEDDLDVLQAGRTAILDKPRLGDTRSVTAIARFREGEVDRLVARKFGAQRNVEKAALSFGRHFGHAGDRFAGLALGGHDLSLIHI